MSNLGMYQWITTASKKVGGPANLLALVAGGGYATLRCVEAAIKAGYRFAKKHIAHDRNADMCPIFVVKMETQYKDMVCFSEGDRIRILDTDKDVALVEKIGDDNNPYFLPVQFLREMIDFE